MFKITKDLIDDGRLDGKYVFDTFNNLTITSSEQMKRIIVDFEKNETQEFRLLDADDEVYFYGLIPKKQFNSANDMEVFEPLDYMKPLYGVVTFQYKENGKWKNL